MADNQEPNPPFGTSFITSMIYAATQGSAEEEEAAELVGTSTPRASWVSASQSPQDTPSSSLPCSSSDVHVHRTDPLVEHDGDLSTPSPSKPSVTPPSFLSLFKQTVTQSLSYVWTNTTQATLSVTGFMMKPLSSHKQTPSGSGPYPLRKRRGNQRHRVNTTSASDVSTTDPDSDASTSSLQHKQPLSSRPSRLTHRHRSAATLGKSSISRSPSLFPKKQKTLVLDLDETLIHSTSRGSRRYDHVIEVLIDKHICLYYVYKRPHVDYFLEKVSQWYKVVVFTASMAEYADPVMDYLDKRGTLFQGRYFRESCTQVNGTYVKNLALLEPDLSQICLVDNSPVSYACNQDNGIPIQGWTHDPNDVALLDLLPFLDALRFCHDVRSILSLRI